MKKFAIALFSFLILVLIGAALLLPSKVEVSRTTEIAAEQNLVFENVAELKNWQKWSPWLAKDPKMTLEYGAKTRGVGASYSWQSESQGSGSMTVSDVQEPSKIQTELDFGDQGTGVARFDIVPEGEAKTKVTWTMVADMGVNPIGKIFGLFMDSMVGPDFEDGLRRLKELSEGETP